MSSTAVGVCLTAGSYCNEIFSCPAFYYNAAKQAQRLHPAILTAKSAFDERDVAHVVVATHSDHLLRQIRRVDPERDRCEPNATLVLVRHSRHERASIDDGLLLCMCTLRDVAPGEEVTLHARAHIIMIERDPPENLFLAPMPLVEVLQRNTAFEGMDALLGVLPVSMLATQCEQHFRRRSELLWDTRKFEYRAPHYRKEIEHLFSSQRQDTTYYADTFANLF